MRGLRSTILLLLVLAGLGAYIYFVTWKLPDENAKPEEKVFTALEAGKIEALQVKSDKGETTALTRTGDAWQITAPEAAKPDETEVGALTSGLASVERGRVVEEEPASLDEYGLAQPRIDVAFKLAGETEYRHLLIGDKTATGGDLFAKLGNEKRVFLIPAYQETTFNKGLIDLRDKTFLVFDHDKVDTIDVNAGGKSFVLSKSGADWNLTKPIQVRADPSAVQGLRARLETAQMTSIVTTEAKPADLQKYGLDKPTRTVKLNFGDGSVTLQLGGTAEDGSVYAREASKPMVVTVDAALAEEVTRGVDEYRRKEVFDFRPFNATRIEFIRASGAALPFEKVKGEAKEGEQPEERWRRLGPNPSDAPKETMDALLSRLSNMRADSFADAGTNTGLDRPELTVVVAFGEGKEERVRFGRVDSSVFAARQGEPDAARVNPTDYSEAFQSLLELSK